MCVGVSVGCGAAGCWYMLASWCSVLLILIVMLMVRLIQTAVEHTLYSVSYIIFASRNNNMSTTKEASNDRNSQKVLSKNKLNSNTLQIMFSKHEVFRRGKDIKYLYIYF
jgi:hypothetical protein